MRLTNHLQGQLLQQRLRFLQIARVEAFGEPPILARPDDFFVEYPARAASDKVDTDEADEVIDAVAKTVAELTSQQDGVIRQQVIEQLMRQIMHYDGEFRREEATSAVGSSAKH